MGALLVYHHHTALHRGQHIPAMELESASHPSYFILWQECDRAPFGIILARYLTRNPGHPHLWRVCGWQLLAVKHLPAVQVALLLP